MCFLPQLARIAEWRIKARYATYFTICHFPPSAPENVCILSHAKLGKEPQVAPAAVNSAVAGYTVALTASLLLLGGAVLHSQKHGPGSKANADKYTTL